MEASLVGRVEVLSAIYLSVQSIYLHLRTLHLILGFYQKKNTWVLPSLVVLHYNTNLAWILIGN
jgi:hypothetical protein